MGDASPRTMAFVERGIVLSVRPADIGLFTVPTVAVVNRQGTITALRRGVVFPNDAERITTELFTGSRNRSSGFKSITEQDVRARLARHEALQLLDPADLHVASRTNNLLLSIF
jgi:hypothetical protein